MARRIRITHRPSGAIIAEGPVGWAITPFEGNYYISSKCRGQGRFTASFIPGICFYKFLYVWVHYDPPGEASPRSSMLGWMYVLPNPLFPFIAWRVAVPGDHPEIEVVELAEGLDEAQAEAGSVAAVHDGASP